MSKHKLWASVVLFFCATLAVWAAGKIMSVQVKQSELRASPSGLASVVASVKLGDRLTVIEEKGVWTQVSTEGGATGWIPSSSLVKGALKVKAGDADAKVAASGDEMSLATKGFNSQVEADFKNQHADIDFTWVDKMGQIKISIDDMRNFLKQGKVGEEGGQAK